MIASIASANSGKENNTSSGDQTTSATTRPATTTSAPTKAASAPRTIGTFTGSGTKKTKRFHVAADDWTIRYSYDCSNFGSQGNFQVFVYNQDDIPDVAVNELAAKGADSTEEHSSGDFYLEINSECTWTIKVIA